MALAPPSTSVPAVPSPTSSAAPAIEIPANGCAAQPSLCGYPDESNTGVADGVVVRSVPDEVSSGPGWHWDPRGWLTVDGNGAVLEGVAVKANIDITGSAVTVRNVRVSVSGDTFGISLRRTHNVVIENVEIAGQDAGSHRLLVGIKDIYGDALGTQILRSDVSRSSTGIQVYSGLIEDNYVHDLGLRGDDHVNGILSTGGKDSLTIRHNTVFNQHGQTDAIGLFQDFGVEANRLIDDNLVAGGAYTIYGGANPGSPPTANIRITNNRIARIFSAKGGAFGHVTAFSPAAPGNVWSGNVWDDTGEVIRTSS